MLAMFALLDPATTSREEGLMQIGFVELGQMGGIRRAAKL